MREFEKQIEYDSRLEMPFENAPEVAAEELNESSVTK
jgi:hypothetical protein